MTSAIESGQQSRIISTGKVEIDRRLGSGIPYRTLMLIEGPAASGKSTLAQQLLWGALTSGEDAVLYTTEQTVHSLLRQMDSLGLDVRDYFLLNHLQIYPVSIIPEMGEPDKLFRDLFDHISRQETSRVIVVDSLTNLARQGEGSHIQDFFPKCKTLCDEGKVIICTVHSGAFDESVLTRVRSVCDAYLRLQVQKSGSELLKTIEVAKIRGADLPTGNISAFAVEPGQGMRMVQISRAKA